MRQAHPCNDLAKFGDTSDDNRSREEDGSAYKEEEEGDAASDGNNGQIGINAKALRDDDSSVESTDTTDDDGDDDKYWNTGAHILCFRGICGSKQRSYSSEMDKDEEDDKDDEMATAEEESAEIDSQRIVVSVNDNIGGFMPGIGGRLF